jgi:2-oxoglutarate ferredoxin oxidoreductase subunit delta
MQVCPRKILRRGTTLNERGIYAIEPSDADACIGCLQCVMVCPDVAITVTDDDVREMEKETP